MKLSLNVCGADRAVRIIVGVALAAVAYFGILTRSPYNRGSGTCGSRLFWDSDGCIRNNCLHCRHHRFLNRVCSNMPY